MYEYEAFDRPMSASYVAVANSELVVGSTTDWHLVLCATTNIKVFEQIGFFYSPQCGYDGSDWPEEPYLFSKDGDIIPKDRYQILSKGVMLVDRLTKQYELLSPVRQDVLEQIHEFSLSIMGYMCLFLGDNKIFIVDSNF